MMTRLKQYLDNPQSVYLIVTLYTVASIFQGVAFGILIAFLQPFLDGDLAAARRPMWWLVGVGIAVFVLFLIPFLLSIRVGAKDICGDVLKRIGESVTRLPLGFFDASTAGKVSSCISNDISTLSHLAPILLPQLISAIVTPTTVAIIMFAYDWRLALIMVAVLPIAGLLWKWSSKTVLKEQVLGPQAEAASEARTLEYAFAQPVLRAQGITGMTWEPLKQALDEDHRVVRQLLAVQRRPMMSFTIVSQTFFALVLGVGLALVVTGEATPAIFLGAAVLSARFTVPISHAVLFASEIQKTMVAFDSIGTIVDTPPLPEPTQPRIPAGNGIELRDVDFSYHKDTPIFTGMSFSAPAGTITALIGPSGCGKSTALRLIARFWDVDGGHVTIGGVDVRDMSTEDLMSRISLVFQDVYLFNGTIGDNIRISRPDATDDEVADAIHRAGLDSVISGLPDGIDTQVGEGGLKLSGGERQRVSIARAFLKDAPILLLDEITSALDAENEAVVTRTLDDLSRNRTVIVIAHRLSTIMNADRVYLLDKDGVNPAQIVEQGCPDDLLGSDGRFAALVASSRQTTRWQVRP